MTEEELDQLREYAVLANDEFGEIAVALLDLAEWNSEQLSDGFKKALEKELKANLKWFNRNCRITRKEVTVTQIYSELEYLF